MRSVYESRVADANQIERQIRAGSDKIVRGKFGAVAKVLWPFKTAAHIGVIGGFGERHAARILSGEFEPPAILIAAVINEITKRD